MTNRGKDLENLVALVERALRTALGKSVLVRTGERTYLEDGSPEAEFDVEVLGEIGGQKFGWSIECRDRPQRGPADAPWIQQLAGRRLQFGHTRVIAVSTTGFTRAAKHAARILDIELRVVKSLSADEFRGWSPEFTAMSVMEQQLRTDEWNLILLDPTDVIAAEADQLMANGVQSHEKILKPISQDEMQSADEAVHGFLQQNNFWLNVAPTGKEYPFKFLIGYESDTDHYMLPLPSGAYARIKQLQWAGKLRQIESAAPVTDRKEYKSEGSDKILSQVIEFGLVSLPGVRQPVKIEIHRIGDPSEDTLIQVVLKPAKPETARKE